MDEDPREFLVPRRPGAPPKNVACPVCGHTRFWTRRSLMNTPGLTFFDLDWANRTARNLVWEDCGHVLWFLD